MWFCQIQRALKQPVPVWQVLDLCLFQIATFRFTQLSFRQGLGFADYTSLHLGTVRDLEGRNRRQNPNNNINRNKTYLKSRPYYAPLKCMLISDDSSLPSPHMQKQSQKW